MDHFKTKQTVGPAAGSGEHVDPEPAAHSGEGQTVFPLSADFITIGEITERICNSLPEQAAQLLEMHVLGWLFSSGFLMEIVCDDGHISRFPTARGWNVGLSIRQNQASPIYENTILLSQKAQRLVADHLDEIIRISQIKTVRAQWKPCQDMALMTLISKRVSLLEIAVTMKRSVYAIVRRLETFGLSVPVYADEPEECGTLITCPSCQSSISDRLDLCPYCGLPSEQFYSQQPVPASDQTLCNLTYSALEHSLAAFDQEYTALFSDGHFITHGEQAHMQQQYGVCLEILQTPSICRYAAQRFTSLQPDTAAPEIFVHRMASLDADAAAHNDAVIETSLETEREYLDGILRQIDPAISLDDEQRRAILTDDDHCLLVAGAGAGKTTTMAAKVKYLVDKKHVSPRQIMVISYTNKAVDELKERINDGLGIPAKVCTFHAFAYQVLRRASSQNGSQKAAGVYFKPQSVISAILEDLIFQDQPLLYKLVLFFGYYFDMEDEVFQCENLEEYHRKKAAREYETLKSRLGDYICKVKHQRAKQGRTLSGEYLRSAQEVQIANFLYLNGLEYIYENPYPYGSLSEKLYTPDFYIVQGDRVAWLEHFALTEWGTNDTFTRQEIQRYQKSILDKEALHRKNHTTLLETWSVYRDNRSLMEHLREVLEQAGFVLNPRDSQEVYEKIAQTAKDQYIFKLTHFMTNFIEHYKTEGYDETGFDLLRSKTDNPRTLLFLEIAQRVYEYYQAALQKNNEIDFADMINNARRCLQTSQGKSRSLPYQYIIIDEFQDIARQRFDLVKSLCTITQAKVVAVGDDWQSIYAFSGSDITLFTRFLELMGSGTELKITHTYRNSQELIDIAGGFVQKNDLQIRKQLISPKHLQDPVQIVGFDDHSSPVSALAETVEGLIGEILEEFGEESSILLIGRYRYDIKRLYRSGLFARGKGNSVQCCLYPEANITFLTAHSSKGLGFDNVIVINLQEDTFGFPCQIEDDPILRLVTHPDTSMPFAEERRLFYVALTRTKNRVYLVAPQSRPSRFLLELIHEFHIPQTGSLSMQITDIRSVHCPVCGWPLKYEFNKNYGMDLWICTNDPEVCDFMTNDTIHMHDIRKCPRCQDGYLIVRPNPVDGTFFYGCTNYSRGEDRCTYTCPLPDSPV